MGVRLLMKLGVITLMPEIFTCLQYGVVGRAIQENKVAIEYINPRDWTLPPHHQVDDRPFGGGAGMVMQFEPLQKAIIHAKTLIPDSTLVYLSPQGKQVVQHDIQQLVNHNKSVIFIAGRYEGIDERIIEKYVDEEWSLGDFVLSGGEFAALAFIDAIIRLIPGALGNPNSVINDSFTDGLLDYPHYTRPAVIEGMEVPDILQSGNHQEIARWRRKQALGKTWLKRPDLLDKVKLTQYDDKLLNEYKRSIHHEHDH